MRSNSFAVAWGSLLPLQNVCMSAYLRQTQFRKLLFPRRALSKE